MTGERHFDLWYLFALAGAVLVGAVLPVLPTGAAVSAGAVLASHSQSIGLVGVLIAGAGGACLGDRIVYGAFGAGGEGRGRNGGCARKHACGESAGVWVAGAVRHVWRHRRLC